MKLFKITIILTCLIFNDIASYAQKDTCRSFIRIGIKGTMGGAKINEINDLATRWMDAIENTTNIQITRPTMLPVNIEYGGQAYISMMPLKFLQIGAKLDYTMAPLEVKVQNSLKLNVVSFIPETYILLTFGKFETGGGLLYSFTNIKVKDDFFGYNDNWYGKNLGYEFTIGFTSGLQKTIGYSFHVSYRSLIVDNVNDSFKRTMAITDSQKNPIFDLTGVSINAGIYLNLFKIRRKK